MQIRQKENNIIDTLQDFKKDLNLDLSDFGDEPILFGKLMKGVELGVVGVILSFVAASAFSPFTGVVSLMILANDFTYVRRKNLKVIDIQAEEIKDENEQNSSSQANSINTKLDSVPNETDSKPNTIKKSSETSPEISPEPKEIQILEKVDVEADDVEEDDVEAEIKTWDLPRYVNTPQYLEKYYPQFGIIAEILNTVFSKIPSHLALHANTRCGKTLTLRAIIYLILQNPGGRENNITIVDFKNSEWMGLPKIQLCERGQITIEPLIAEIEKTYKMLCSRIENRLTEEPRQWLIIEEWYRTYPKIKNHEDGAEILEKLNDIAQLGLEYGIHLLLVIQNHQCEKFGFDSQSRFAFRFISVGREQDYRTIQSVLRDAYMIPSESVRNSARKQVKCLLQSLEDLERPIALDATTGKVEQLPDLQWLEEYHLPEQILSKFRLKNDNSIEHLDSSQLVLEYIKRKGALNVRQIQQAKIQGCQTLKKTDLESLLSQLEKKGKITSIVLEDTKYYRVLTD